MRVFIEMDLPYPVVRDIEWFMRAKENTSEDYVGYGFVKVVFDNNTVKSFSREGQTTCEVCGEAVYFHEDETGQTREYRHIDTVKLRKREDGVHRAVPSMTVSCSCDRVMTGTGDVHRIHNELCTVHGTLASSVDTSQIPCKCTEGQE